MSVPQTKVERAKEEFCSLSPCCLDPFWGKRAQEKVKAGEWDFKAVTLEYFQSFRPVSLREEQYHTIQRQVAGGERGKAHIGVRQRAQSVVSNGILKAEEGESWTLPLSKSKKHTRQ